MLLLVIVAVDDLNKFTALGDSTFTFHAVVDGVELKAFVVDDTDDENAPGAALNNGVTGGLIPPVVGVTAALKPTLDWVLFHPLLVTPKLGVVFVIGEFVVDDLKTLLENNEVVVLLLLLLLPLLLVVVLVIDAGDDDGLIVVNKLVTVTDVGVVGILDDADDNDEDDGVGNDEMDDNDGCNGNTAIGGTSR